jgi:hypothetical protein
MKPLPKGYRPLTKAQRKEQGQTQQMLFDLARDRRDKRQRLIATVPHEGDRRTCPACKLGLP